MSENHNDAPPVPNEVQKPQDDSPESLRNIPEQEKNESSKVEHERISNENKDLLPPLEIVDEKNGKRLSSDQSSGNKDKQSSLQQTPKPGEPQSQACETAKPDGQSKPGKQSKPGEPSKPVEPSKPGELQAQSGEQPQPGTDAPEPAARPIDKSMPSQKIAAPTEKEKEQLKGITDAMSKAKEHPEQALKDLHKAFEEATPLDSFGGKDKSRFDRLSKLYSSMEFGTGRDLKEDLQKTFSKPQNDVLLEAAGQKSNGESKKTADEIDRALKYIGGDKSVHNDQAVLKSMFGLSPEHLQHVDQHLRSRDGYPEGLESVRDKLSPHSQKYFDILTKGSNPTERSQEFADQALKDRNAGMFRLGMANSSPDARQKFMDNGGEQKLKDAFQKPEWMSYLPGGKSEYDSCLSFAKTGLPSGPADRPTIVNATYDSGSSGGLIGDSHRSVNISARTTPGINHIDVGPVTGKIGPEQIVSSLQEQVAKTGRPLGDVFVHAHGREAGGVLTFDGQDAGVGSKPMLDQFSKLKGQFAPGSKLTFGVCDLAKDKDIVSQLGKLADATGVPVRAYYDSQSARSLTGHGPYVEVSPQQPGKERVKWGKQ